ncbi:MAG: DNA gyrase inhibitor YacG [Rhodospirillales bacterium]|nr:DNA gyrase inhibitor YacG [Rhodospirillales bacterium]
MAEQPKQKAKVVPFKSRKCTNCGKPTVVEFMPFCSERCANLDLGRWLNGDYRIPTDEAPPDGAFSEADDDES